MVVLDTNLIIDHLRQRSFPTRLEKLAEEKPKEALAVSMISVQELYEGQSTRDSEKETQLLSILSGLKILPYTYEVAELAGQLARDKKEPITLSDAAIAATAILNNAELLTLDQKDFRHIKDLELFS